MADDFIGLDEPTTIDKKVDTDSLTVGANTVHRGRIRIAGAAATDIAPVDAANGLDVDVTRLPALPAGTNNIGDVDVLTVPAPLSTTGGGTEAAALRVTVANDSTGVLSVDDNGGSLTVDGTVGISGTVPISAAALPLPAGASTAALQTQPGVDIGDVTINNAAGAAAVNVQDGGNSITVDGTVTANAGTGPFPVSDNAGSLTVDAPVGTPVAARLSDGAAFYDAAKTGQLPAALVGGRLDDNVGSWMGSTAPTVGQKAMASSLPVAIASDQSALTANGDVDHDAVNTLKNIQIAGNANPVDVPPTAVSANGDRVRAWMDRYGSLVVRTRKIRESYTAVFRLAEAAARLDQTFTHTANTNKQWATLHHTGAATKEVRLMSCVVWVTNMTTVAPQGIIELRQISAAPATGNPAITPTPHRRGAAAAEAVALYLPTTAGTEANVNSPLGHHVFDDAVSVATAAFAHPQGYGRGGIVLYDSVYDDDEMMQPVLPVGTLDGWAVVSRLTGATVMRATVVMKFTEEVP